jgi:hypothetical protein
MPKARLTPTVQVVDRSVGWVEECWRSLSVRRQPNSLSPSLFHQLDDVLVGLDAP